MSTRKSNVKVKVTKVSKNPRIEADDAAPTKSKKTAGKVKLLPKTKISYLSPRPKGAGGPKTTLLNLVPKKGMISFGKLKALAIDAEINEDRIEKMLSTMAKNGRVELHA